jgi:predicted RNase H-like HicB family nuclease
MSAKWRRSAKALDRPFDAAVWAKAGRIADQYQVILSMEDGHWYGRGLEMPHVFGDGDTVAKCVKDTRAALQGAVAYLLEEGRRPPPPARGGKRTQQVNVRLTPEEKVVLETAARDQGFAGLSEFIRAAAMVVAK